MMSSQEMNQLFIIDQLVLCALAQGQIVLCPKNTWRCVLFLGRFWADMIELTVEDILGKYRLPPSYKPIVTGYKDCFVTYKNYISFRGQVEDFDRYRKRFLPRSSRHDVGTPVLEILHRTHKLYELFIQHNYLCKEFNDRYILFMPQKKLDEHQRSSGVVLDCFAPGLTDFDVSLGMNWSRLCDYRYQGDLFSQPVQPPLPASFKSLDAAALGFFLKDALQKLLINKNSIHKELQRFTPVMLPRFNFLIQGHGDPGSMVVGIHPNDIGTILQRFQHQVHTKSVALISCYLGGQRFKDVFGHSYQSLNPWLEQITYPILCSGSFFSVAVIFINYAQMFLPNGKLVFNYFDSYFEVMSSSNIDYFKALEILHLSITHILYDEFYVNYGSIKFPYTGWMNAADDFNVVVNLTAVKSAQRDRPVDIAGDKKYVLMSTNRMLSPIVVHQKDLDKLPMFIPVHYVNQCYHFSKLHFPDLVSKNYSIRLMLLVLEKIFYRILLSKLNLSENIIVVIDELQVGSLIVKNVVCDLALDSGKFTFQDKSFEFHYKEKESRYDELFVYLGHELDILEIDTQAFMADVDFYKRKAQDDSVQIAGLRAEFLDSLQQCLKPHASKMPLVAAKSHGIYAGMSDEAKEANIFRKKPKERHSVALPV